LKKGAPTVIFSPFTASDKTGNIVPQKTEKQINPNTILLNRNPLSRDVNDSIFLLAFSTGSRIRTRVIQKTRIRIIKPRNTGPKSETAKEWTEDIIPLRVKNVPKIQRINVVNIKIIFQVFSIPFFS
tara:strand:+ start:258 stop:638 length:381 start_codon:yes stop_codon:yes gene_type:complete